MCDSDKECDAVGIPKHLHWLKKNKIDMKKDEILYRRYCEKTSHEYKGLYTLKKMSTNRNIYSKKIETLLCCSYREDKTTKENYERIQKQNIIYDKYSVGEYVVKDIENILINFENKMYSFKVLHKPKKCNFSHSILQLVYNGNTYLKQNKIALLDEELVSILIDELREIAKS